jgi:hypothetical protein
VKKLLIFVALAYGMYQYITWKPTTLDIASGMEVGESIQFQGNTFQSKWSAKSDTIEAYVRRIDRHYSENLPIVTHDFVLTTGDYNDPNIVSLRHRGGGNYYFSWKTRESPKGSLIVYHLIPTSAYVQRQINNIKMSDTIKLSGKISQDSKITSSTGAYLQLMHDNHKFILVDDINAAF